MFRPLFLASAVLALSANWLVAQDAAKPTAAKLNLNFIPDDAVAALVAHPQRLLASPHASLWPTEIITAMGKKELGFDPLEVEQVVAIAGMPQPGGAQPQALIVRFRKPIDIAAVANKIVPKGADDKLEGQQARLADSNFQPSLAFPDDRTMLLAKQPDLVWMLTAKPGPSALHQLLQQADDAPCAAVYLAIEPIRPVLAGILPMIQNSVPPMFHDLLDLPMTVDTAQLTANVAGESANRVQFQLKLTTSDADTAKNIATVIQRALADGRSLITAQAMQGMQMNEPEDQEIKQATAKYIRRVGDAIVAALNPQPAGNQVTINAEVKAGMTEVGMLTGLMLPAVQAARDAARRAQSMNNLKQIGLTFHIHHDQKKSFPAQANYDANGKPLLSWRVHMLPYMEENELYQQFHLDEPWDSEHNKPLIEKMPAIYRHPKFDKPGLTIYQAIVGKGAAFEGKQGLRLQSFTDGTSNTIMAVEVAPEKAVPWTKPADWEFDPEKDVDTKDFGGLIAGDGFNAVFADGSVRFIQRSIDPDLLKKLFTRHGGEPVRAP